MKKSVLLVAAVLLATTAVSRADAVWSTASSKWVDVQYPNPTTSEHYSGGSWSSPVPSDYVIETRSAAELRAKALQESGYNPKNDFDEYGNVGHN